MPTDHSIGGGGGGGIKNKDEYHMWPDHMYLVPYRPDLTEQKMQTY